jgi:hypothetical protein
MKSLVLVLRCALEGLLGASMMLATLAGIAISLLNSYGVAYTLVSLTGSFILGALGFYMFRDAIRVGRRLRSKPEINSISN